MPNISVGPPLAYFEKVTLSSGDIAVMDNPSAHRLAAAQTGAKLDQTSGALVLGKPVCDYQTHVVGGGHRHLVAGVIGWAQIAIGPSAEPNQPRPTGPDAMELSVEPASVLCVSPYSPDIEGRQGR